MITLWLILLVQFLLSAALIILCVVLLRILKTLKVITEQADHYHRYDMGEPITEGPEPWADPS